MKNTSALTVTNTSEKEIVFHLEPWGEQIKMPSGAKFDIVAEAEQAGSLQIDYGLNEVVVWGWAGSIVRIYRDGQEIRTR